MNDIVPWADDDEPKPDDLDEIEWEALDFDWATEEWVLAGDALRETTEFYLAAGDGDRSRAATAALSAIKRRLENNTLFARAHRWEYSVWHELTSSDPSIMEALAPQISDNRNSDLIHFGFWWALEQAEREAKEPIDPDCPQEHRAMQDWVAGDFDFRSWMSVRQGPMKATTVEGFAQGVCFNRSGLPSTNRLTSFGDAKRIERPARASKKGKPLPDAALLAWWDGLPHETKQMPIDEILVPLCRTSFPQHLVSRERVRALVPGRKRGPRPIR